LQRSDDASQVTTDLAAGERIVKIV